ncbi:hypothetical protein [Crenothrix polyspora]|jgi:hypothetical protein|uniref:Uncharacterized protein n=1 Tax=Crenothrix polyspora TaxID=360316 RepID=A0A1R4GYD5_9GAMM|nr:hypothetical protein [Crenothrix polyspora]SJM89006.1 conserved hypothetical protein [Crenothrix polyspora]
MDINETEYEFRPEYDLKNLKLKKLNATHKSYGELIRLESDVALIFPDSESVNEALRYLIEMTKRRSPYNGSDALRDNE